MLSELMAFFSHQFFIFLEADEVSHRRDLDVLVLSGIPSFEAKTVQLVEFGIVEKSVCYSVFNRNLR